MPQNLDALDWFAEPTGLFPLVIGLGRRSNLAIAELLQCRRFQPDVLLCQLDAIGTTCKAETILDRLTNSCCVVLIVDLNDPWARSAAIQWVENIDKHDIYLRIIIAICDKGDADVPDRLSESDATLILASSGSKSDQESNKIVQAILPGLAFLQPSFFCYDISDLRRVLNHGPQWLAASDTLKRGIGFSKSLLRLRQLLPLERSAAAIALISGDDQLLIEDFDGVVSTIYDLFPENASVLVIPLLTGQFHGGELRIGMVALASSGV